MAYDDAIEQWREGERRLRRADPKMIHALERVIDALVSELRRRLGGAFDVDELVALYEQGTDWCLDVAVATAPEDPHTWAADTVVGAAFARYARDARDFAGGRRLVG
ncbi:MAG TPA: hypothetical protein VIL64_03135 [Solirubrobacteraceae bacterium]